MFMAHFKGLLDRKFYILVKTHSVEISCLEVKTSLEPILQHRPVNLKCANYSEIEKGVLLKFLINMNVHKA